MTTATARPDTGEWITLKSAERLLAVGYKGVRNLIEGGLVTVRRVPGSTPRVLRREIEALAEASTRPADQPAVKDVESSGHGSTAEVASR